MDLEGLGIFFRAKTSGILEKFEVVAVNDITDTKTLAYLLKYDSVHGTLNAEVKHKEDTIIINGKEIKVLCEKDPANLPWKALGVEIVLESTGLFTDERMQKNI